MSPGGPFVKLLCGGTAVSGHVAGARRFSVVGQLGLWGASLVLLLISAVGVAAATDVVTYHNDTRRTGQNQEETILTPVNVNSATFGKLFNVSVDGMVDAEPLYLSAVTIPGKGIHNVLYVETENDSVYAFDADVGTLLWNVSVLGAGETPSGDHGCNQISPQIGITSTPVIDRSRGPHGTIYVVGMSMNAGTYFQRIHALDVTTGQEEFGGPVTVQAKYPGTGDNTHSGFVVFDPSQYAERQGLLLLNGVVYLGWTSHCDHRPYTGWVMGYDANTLTQTSVLNLTPNGSEGSVWQAGAGMASGGANIFLLDANGTFDTALDANGFPAKGDYGNAFLKLGVSNNRQLAVADYFEMHNTVQESDEDVDLGSGGVLIVPVMTDANGVQRSLAIGAGKDGNIYIVDRNNLGKFNPNQNAIYQEIDGVLGGGIWSMPAYFAGNVYFGPVNNRLLQFHFSRAKLSTSPVSQSPEAYPYPGSTPSVSANGSQNGIVWAIGHYGGSSILRAYDASNLAHEIYNSGTALNGRDRIGQATHFGTPMIVNGKVYVGTTNGVAVFGLLK